MFKKKNLVILVLFVIVIMMSVGFAVLSTTLNINGVSNVKGQTWDIHFANIDIAEGSVIATKEANIVNDKATLVEYEITLEKPGDFYEFTVDAVNDGTLDAKVTSVALSGIEGYEDYLKYEVTYDNDDEIAMNDKLDADTSKKYKVRIEYREDIETPIQEDTTFNLVFAVTYNQAD